MVNPNRSFFGKKVLGTMVLVIAMSFATLTHAQIDRPREHPAGPSCFERWINIATSRLNAYNGGEDYNRRKPYRFSPWGLPVHRFSEQVSAPDNWHQFGGNKYWWMWAYYRHGTYAWSNADWNRADVPLLKPFVLKCIQESGPGDLPRQDPNLLRELVGKWRFGRLGGAYLAEIELTAEWSLHGYRIKAFHSNESTWHLDGNDLIFRSRGGLVTSRFRRQNRDYWTGPFVLQPNLKVTHYISRGSGPPPEPDRPPGSNGRVAQPLADDRTFVTSLYQSILDREPDSRGLEDWVKQLRYGRTREWVITQFFSSAEYRSRNKTDREFVLDLYQGVLGRQPDATDWSHWVGWLQRGSSRQEVLNRFFSSREYRNIIAKRSRGTRGLEYETNRPGLDYRTFDLKAADPILCRKACEQEPQCRAWTYVKPGVQGPNARCWLKHAVPKPVENNCCVSGIK